jgi:hypothetical protein
MRERWIWQVFCLCVQYSSLFIGVLQQRSDKKKRKQNFKRTPSCGQLYWNGVLLQSFPFFGACLIFFFFYFYLTTLSHQYAFGGLRVRDDIFIWEEKGKRRSVVSALPDTSHFCHFRVEGESWERYLDENIEFVFRFGTLTHSDLLESKTLCLLGWTGNERACTVAAFSPR